ncbi:unnamed protein product [Vitrella brassicaformis CCMP3155]|uniref:UBX domain-containing protein n=2 Tax=Vitrella brassicaformis TaxID=1169539 RepID=A0A0G4FC06_VITBC|nr:unnamed protein product [Vitrella brassicaformis CCMP3155]|eukprot:CEM10731.1 unnamed protein product [Vitrella brassicaformis CCMP3155]
MRDGEKRAPFASSREGSFDGEGGKRKPDLAMTSKRALSQPSGSASSLQKARRVEGGSSAAAVLHFGSSQLRIGTSGYNADHWVGSYYHAVLEKGSKQQFQKYSSEFDCVEINATFYNLPVDKTWRGWKAQAPRASFTYVIKANQYFTHTKKLIVDDNFKKRWGIFWDRCQLLGEHLGPILFQLPPTFKCNAQRLANLSTVLPKDGRFVFEFRHPSWFCEEVYRVLRAHDWCLCHIHLVNCINSLDDKKSKQKWAGHMQDGWHRPLDADSCCSWGVYIWLHGTLGMYLGCYPSSDLQAVANRMRAFTKGPENRHRTTYYMLNNTDGGLHTADGGCVQEPSAVVDARAVDDLLAGRQPSFGLHPQQTFMPGEDLELAEAIRLSLQATHQQAPDIAEEKEDPDLAKALRLSLQETHEQALPPPPDEPASGDPTCSLQVRLPWGARITRKFAPSHTIKDVFHWVEWEQLGGIDPKLSQRDRWSLVAFPRKRYASEKGRRIFAYEGAEDLVSDVSDSTLQSLGFQTQETLNLQP